MEKKNEQRAEYRVCIERADGDEVTTVAAWRFADKDLGDVGDVRTRLRVALRPVAAMLKLLVLMRIEFLAASARELEQADRRS